jgi:uncharacterized protein (DUF305 family)
MKKSMAAAGSLLTAAVLAACGGAAGQANGGHVHPAPSEASAAPADTAKPRGSEADARFMRGMITHHAQALGMTALVPARSARDDVRLLAQRIEVSQQGEIALMRRWLEAHGHDAPAADAHSMHGAGGHAAMPGMLTPEEMGVGRLPRRPGRRLGLRQPAVHVGRADARPRRLRHAGGDRPVSAERFRGVRIFDISDMDQPEAGRGGADLPRLAHAHAGDRPEGQGQRLRLRLRHRRCGRATELATAARAGRSRRTPEHVALQHRRDPGAARRAAEARIVNARASSPTRRPAPSPACGEGGAHGPGTQSTAQTNQCHDITVYPELGLAAGACSGNGILLDISRSGEPGRIDAR